MPSFNNERVPREALQLINDHGVMDVVGDTAFEKQSALFALVTSDILIINMWEKDVGLEQSANRPLLGTIFQVLLRLPGDHKCRTTLLFVIRDTTNTTSFRDMERYLRNDVQEIWKNTPKPPAHEKTELKQFFTVEVATLPHFYLQQELFQEEVSKLRARFNNPFQPGGLAAHRQGVVPGSAFSTSIIEIWRSIKENNYLNLPAHKVMLAKWRCPKIVQEQLSALLEDPVWKLLDESAKKGPVPGFAKTWNDLLQKYLLKYDDAGVKEDKRADLRARALAIVQPAYQAAISNLRNGTLNKFKSDTKDLAERPAGGRPPSSFLSAVKQCAEQALADFDQGSSDFVKVSRDWDSRETREKLQRDIDSHVEEVIIAYIEKQKREESILLSTLAKAQTVAAYVRATAAKVRAAAPGIVATASTAVGAVALFALGVAMG